MNLDRASTRIPSCPTVLDVWLAGHEARSLFNPEAQTASEQARWKALVSPARRQEWEISRALLANARTTGATYSLSHSAGHATVVTSEGATAVGADLECVTERDFLRLARFAFADAEYQQLEALQPTERALRFYFLWTLKEAFTKALGRPLLANVRECTFLLSEDKWIARVPTSCPWVAHVFQPRPRLVLCAVALLAHTCEPGKTSVRAQEWPVKNASPWPALAVLSSVTACAQSSRS